MTSYAAAKAAVDGYIAGFAAGDVEAIVALYVDDATVEDPVGTEVKQGADAIRAFYTMSMATGAKLAPLGPIRVAGDYVAFPFAVQLEWQGKAQRIEVIDLFRLNTAGKITEMRAFWGPENMLSD